MHKNHALQLIWRILTAPFRGCVSLGKKILRLAAIPFIKIISFFTDTSDSTSNPLVDTLPNVVKYPNSLMPHIISLRIHIIRSFGVIFFLSLLAFIYVKPILEYLAKPLPGGIAVLTAIDVTENIGAVMKVALLAGFATSIPYIALEIYLFFAPAMKPSTRLSSLSVIPLAMALFISGMAFAYYVMLPVALPFLFNFMGLTTQPRPSSYFNFITTILFWIGIFFEFPLVAFLLARIGVLKSQFLKTHWRIAVIIMAIIAAFITPTVDPINMALVMGPMLILYLFAIFLTALGQRKLNTD